MKKVIVAIIASLVMAAGANAEMVYNTAVSYGKSDLKASLSGEATAVTLDDPATTTVDESAVETIGFSESVSEDAKAIAIKQEIGYKYKNIQALGYLRLENNNESGISNALSYGVGVDYVNDRFFAGVQYGMGARDMDTESKVKFKDLTVRAGYTIPMNSWSLSIGIENVNRDYDSIAFTETSGNVTLNGSIDVEERITSLFVAASF